MHGERLLTLREEGQQVLHSELVFGLQKCMQACEVDCVPAEMGFCVLNFDSRVCRCLACRLVQPYKQVPDVEFRFCTFHQ